jgi:hypothetical protein
MNKGRIVVTGATRKMGSVVVTELLKARYPVHALMYREDARVIPKVQPGPPANKIRIHRIINIILCG